MRSLVLPAAARFTRFDSWEQQRQLCEQDFEPLQQQRARQLERLRAILEHAYLQTTHTFELLNEVGLHPREVESFEAFCQVPVTTKDHLRRDFPNRQLARTHRSNWLRYSNTSGTSGRPLMLIQDLDDICAKYATLLRSRHVGGVDPFGPQLRVTPNECQPALPDGTSPDRPCFFCGGFRQSRGYVFIEREVVHPLLHKRRMLEPFWHEPGHSGLVEFGRYLDRIDAHDTHVLQLHPLYALAFAKHIRRSGRPPPRVSGAIDCSGALLPPKVRALVSETFGARMTQACGGCEFGRYAASCVDDPDRLHLAEGYDYVETVRPDGTPCEPGELGNVLATSLHSRAMPIVRIEPGDVARILDDPCRCGRKSRRIQHEGRIQSLMLNAEGRWVTARECWDALLPLEGVQLFQLEQHAPEHYSLRLVPEPGLPLPQDAIDESLEALLGSDARVDQRMVPAIDPEASAKLRLVKSSTYQAFRPAQVRDLRVPVN